MVGAPPLTITILPPPGGYGERFFFSVDAPEQRRTYSALTLTFRGFVVRADRSLPPPKRLLFLVDNREFWACDVALPRPDVVDAIRDRPWFDLADEADLFCGFDSVLPTFLSEHPRRTMDVFIEFGSRLDRTIADPVHLLSVRVDSASDFLKSGSIGVTVINSIGRSGSSMLSRVLSQHPDMFVPSLEGQYGEVFIMGHFARILALLSSEGSLSYVNKVMPEPDFIMMMSGYSALDQQPDGFEVELRSRLDQIGYQHGCQMYHEALEALAHYVRKCKPGARYWLEKSWNSSSANLMRAMTVSFKEIILIRSPFDFWRSQELYHQKIRSSIHDRMSHAASTFDKYKYLAHSAHDRRNVACLIRYEDLTLHPEATLSRICNYLDIEPEPAYLAQFSDVIRNGDEFKSRMQTSGPGDGQAVEFQRYLEHLPVTDLQELTEFCRVFDYKLHE